MVRFAFYFISRLIKRYYEQGTICYASNWSAKVVDAAGELISNKAVPNLMKRFNAKNQHVHIGLCIQRHYDSSGLICGRSDGFMYKIHDDKGECDTKYFQFDVKYSKKDI